MRAFARRAGYELVGEFYDAAVSGADPVDLRPGFAALLTRIAGNGVKVVIVETANRFARDLIVQETGHRMLRNLGIELIAADSPDSFVDDTPTAVMVRQILGAVAQFDKAALVATLKGARERMRKATGKCEGRLSRAARAEKLNDKETLAKLIEATRMAKRLRRANPKTGERLSLRGISAALAEAGHLNERGEPYHPQSVRYMLDHGKPLGADNARAR